MRYYKNHSEDIWKLSGIMCILNAVVFSVVCIIGMFMLKDKTVRIVFSVLPYFVCTLFLMGAGLDALACSQKTVLRLDKLPKQLKYNYLIIYFLISFFAGIVFIIISWYALKSYVTERIIIMSLLGFFSLVCLTGSYISCKKTQSFIFATITLSFADNSPHSIKQR